MTLVVALLTDNEAIMISDMRFSFPSLHGPCTIADDQMQKMVVAGPTSAFAYTGVGRFTNGYQETMHEWIVKIFAKHDIRDAKSGAWLLKECSRYRFGSVASGKQFHAFIGMGWEKNKHDRYMPCVYEISNLPPNATRPQNSWFLKRHQLRHANYLSLSHFGTEFLSSTYYYLNRHLMWICRNHPKQRQMMIGVIVKYMSWWAKQEQSRNTIGQRFTIATIPRTHITIASEERKRGLYMQTSTDPNGDRASFSYANLGVPDAHPMMYMPSFVNGKDGSFSDIKIESLSR